MKEDTALLEGVGVIERMRE